MSAGKYTATRSKIRQSSKHSTLSFHCHFQLYTVFLLISAKSPVKVSCLHIWIHAHERDTLQEISQYHRICLANDPFASFVHGLASGHSPHRSTRFCRSICCCVQQANACCILWIDVDEYFHSPSRGFLAFLVSPTPYTYLFLLPFANQ